MHGLSQIATVLIVLLAAVASSARATEHPAENVDLCSVVRTPAKYSHHRISFDADVLADGHHGSVLIAPGCEGGILPDFANSEAAGDQYSKALFTGGPGTINKDIHGRFSGVFRLGSSSDVFSCELRKRKPREKFCYLLEIESIDNLKIVFKPGEEPFEPSPGMPAPFKW